MRKRTKVKKKLNFSVSSSEQKQIEDQLADIEAKLQSSHNREINFKEEIDTSVEILIQILKEDSNFVDLKT